MKKAIIIFGTTTGNTEAMAEFIGGDKAAPKARGAESQGF